ncbi:MAG: DUF5711 family protein [Eubacteriales bacterium]
MSDNVVQFPNGAPRKNRPEKPSQPKKSILPLIWRLVGIVLFVLVAVGIYVYRDELNIDQLSRSFANLNAQAEDNFGAHNFGTHSTNRYTLYEGGLAVASVSGLELYDESSDLSEKIGNSMNNPAIYRGNKAVLAYDISGTNLAVADFNMEALAVLQIDGQILDADLSTKDSLVYSYANDANKTVITVCNDKMEEYFKWYSATRYMPLCTINEDGSLLAATALGQSGGVFQTDLCLFDTSSEDAVTTVALGNQTYFDLEFLKSGTIVAIGEDSAQFLDETGTTITTYDYVANELNQVSYWDSGDVTLCLQNYGEGNVNQLVTLNGNGDVVAETTVDGVVVNISNAGHYLAVLTTEWLWIFRDDLTVYGQTNQVIGTSAALMESDGSCILIGGGVAELFMP